MISLRRRAIPSATVLMGESGSKANLGGDGVRYPGGGSSRLFLKELGDMALSLEEFKCAPRRGDFAGDPSDSASVRPESGYQAMYNVDTKFDAQRSQN